jgi:hypothetical protein
MLTSGSSAIGTGPTSVYTLATFIALFIHLISKFNMFVFVDRSHIHMLVTNFLLIFWIKICLNLPKCLTIQKHDRHFSVTGLALLLRLSQMYLTEPIRDDKPNRRRCKSRKIEAV